MGVSRKWSYIALRDGSVVGAYYLTANQGGGGAHVSNCGYITREDARGTGVARQMCEHSLSQARSLGFKAMQYNCVLSTNEGAVRLWKRLGFDSVGTLLKAFDHPCHGLVDAYVMYQSFD